MAAIPTNSNGWTAYLKRKELEARAMNAFGPIKNIDELTNLQLLRLAQWKTIDGEEVEIKETHND